jgi:hypothetical protein
MATALRELFYSAEVEFDKRGALRKGSKAIDKTEKSVGSFDKTVKKSTGSMQALVAAVGGSATIAAFSRLVNSTVESTNEISRWSSRLSISERDMHNWAATASLFGADVEDVADAFKELQLKAQDAATGTQSYLDAFQMVGLSMDQIRPVMNDSVALMDLFTTALNNNVESGRQAFVVDELMSDAGTRMLPVFRQGTEGIRRLNREADRMGGETFPELARQTREYTRAQRRSNRAWVSLRNSLVSKVLPSLGRMMEAGEDLLVWIQEMTENSNILKAAMIVLGGVAAGAAVAAATAWGAALWPILAVAAAVAVVTLGIDDLYTTAEDPEADTLTRRFLEWALGARGAADAILFLNSVVADLRAGLEAISQFLWGTTEVGAGGQIEVTNVPSAIAAATQWLTGPSGEAPTLTAEQQRELEQIRSRRADEQRVLEELGVFEPAPGTVEAELAEADPFTGEQSVPQEFRGDQRAARREHTTEARQRRRDAREGERRGRTARREFERAQRGGRSTLPTAGGAAGATLNVEQNLAVNIGTVNEASDAQSVEEQAVRAARQVTDESQAAMARDIETMLGSAEDASLLVALGTGD